MSTYRTVGLVIHDNDMGDYLENPRKMYKNGKYIGVRSRGRMFDTHLRKQYGTIRHLQRVDPKQFQIIVIDLRKNEVTNSLCIDVISRNSLPWDARTT